MKIFEPTFKKAPVLKMVPMLGSVGVLIHFHFV